MLNKYEHIDNKNKIRICEKNIEALNKKLFKITDEVTKLKYLELIRVEEQNIKTLKLKYSEESL